MTRSVGSFRSVVAVAALAAGLVFVGSSPASAAGKGRIEGTVSSSHGSKGLVVYVVKAAGNFDPVKHAEMDQHRMKFVPHVMAVVQGTTVDFLNSDHINHNVFSPDNEGYNLGSWGYGQHRSYTFKSAGVYTQLCSLHPEMEAYIVVLQNPYYAISDSDGHFTIKNIPDGHYQLKVWGEHLKSKAKKRVFSVNVQGGIAHTSINL